MKVWLRKLLNVGTNSEERSCMSNSWDEFGVIRNLMSCSR